MGHVDMLGFRECLPNGTVYPEYGGLTNEFIGI
jgi:hypothetical protein